MSRRKFKIILDNNNEPSSLPHQVAALRNRSTLTQDKMNRPRQGGRQGLTYNYMVPEGPCRARVRPQVHIKRIENDQA